ncbi:MAG: 4Fe-4S dicluster domain-containing protein [Sulfurospirillaceae bacterium]|nr:4Fe-4S dicluster domain-containing protein [Sulfurospirillaceae bacterium]
MKIDQAYIDKDRRGFIEKVIKGSVAGSLMLMIPMNSELFAKVLGQDKKGLSLINPTDKIKNYAFMVDVTSCIGCGNCCVADRAENSVPEGQYRTWVERYVIDIYNTVYVDAPNGGEAGYATPRADIKNEIKDAFFVPKLCNMCAEPSCVQVCPVAATFKSPDGFVLVDNKHCVACGYCVQACPYGVRFINNETKTADKCTWCYHRVVKGKLPACVNACPTQARKFGDLNDPESEVAKIFRSKTILKVLKKPLGNEPALYYVGAREEII